MSASIIVNCCSGVWSLIRITNVGWDGSVVQQRHDLVSAPWLSLTLCQQISARHSDTSYSSQSAEGCICTQQPWTRIDLRHYFELRYFGKKWNLSQNSMLYLGRIWWKLQSHNFILKIFFFACACNVVLITDQFWIKWFFGKNVIFWPKNAFFWEKWLFDPLPSSA